MVRSHLRNAFVEDAYPTFWDSVPTPGAPRDVLIDIPLPLRINWLVSLLRSMPLNAVIDRWTVEDDAIGPGNLLPLVRCALKAHRKLDCVRKLGLSLFNRNATWARLSNLLSQRSIQEFSEIACSTSVDIDISELCTILSSRRSPKLHLACRGIWRQDPILTLPAQLIRDFVTLRDVSMFVDEFSLRLAEDDDHAFEEMPDVDDATDRRRKPSGA
ncbi:hypothetical protein AAVH_16013 [Aphelenchoides avenae]|nr:hypothetical protein AAVH_16013 [Aphelenchus avenae]